MAKSAAKGHALRDVAPEPDKSTRLKSYRLAVRKPSVVSRDGNIEMTLPTYFGGRKWIIPLRQIAVRDLSAAPSVDNTADREPVLARELRVPYLFTTGPVTKPNLQLMFDEPQRVPPVRLAAAFAPNTDLPFGYRSTRSQIGDHVDGVLLRAYDSAKLSRLLKAAGARPFDDPTSWMHEHRTIVSDATERDTLTRRRRTGRSLQRVAAVLLFATLVAGRWLLPGNGPWWPVLLLLGVLIGLLGLAAVGRRLAR
ncbi:hypothetical protein [Pseudofrankia inefficax]|uniref:Uncharacterized protein n=1 Tax=Pseudofrankia inefficax (strain DSM 45817 / CECT 9037 / DDB 130130 / EuI1c) TaxID=298654 RepID=E3ITZ7_PSEI1|nr:hypothetical protein [Pseudofrankia inefficax]ADP81190.1 hypothetical protein FraEuI1c_3175 [Pseudofrankia inefficax]